VVFDTTGYAMVSVALATALFHTLIPDHWLPFVLIGRARGWTIRHTMVVSGLSAGVHVVLSVLLGGLALIIGATVAGVVGETLEHAGALLLVAFGLGYAWWAFRKGGHFHPGGARVHADLVREACDGHEGDSSSDHLHYHADERLIVDRSASGDWWLALIIGVNPCVLVLPMVFAAASRGVGAVALVSLAYALPTAGLMIGMSALGVAGGRQVRLPLAARYMELASGLLIALLGAVMLFVHA